MADLVDLRSGAVVRDYRIERRVGAGGFGITYIASDLDARRVRTRAESLNGRIRRYLRRRALSDEWRRWSASAAGPMVAIKEYFPEGGAARTANGHVSPARQESRDDFTTGLRDFLDEARIIGDLFHPNIVTVFDVFEDQGTAYYVMEYVPGETLEQRVLRQGRQSPEQVEGWLDPLLDALACLHGRGVLHLDVSPQNLILRGGGEAPVLIDFGSSRATAARRSRDVGRLVNDGYSAPEKYAMDASKLTRTADLYSAAATALFALDGRPPPSAVARLQDPRPLVGGSRASRLHRALQPALEIEAKARPSSIAEWRSTLGPRRVVAAPVLARGEAEGAAATRPSGDGAAGDRRRLALRMALGLAAGALATAVAIALAAPALFSLLRPSPLKAAEAALAGRAWTRAAAIAHAAQGPSRTADWALLLEAQALFCQYGAQGGSAAREARGAFVDDLNAAVRGGGPLAGEASFRLGYHLYRGWLYGAAGETSAPACDSATGCFDQAVAAGYAPARLLRAALSRTADPGIDPRLAELTEEPAGWPRGLHPADCSALDVTPGRWGAAG